MQRTKERPQPGWRGGRVYAALGFEAAQLGRYCGVIINNSHGPIMTEPAATRNSRQAGTQPGEGCLLVLATSIFTPFVFNDL